MKKTNQVEKVIYPFSDLDPPAYKCRCGILLRKSNLHNRIYKVSETDPSEILTPRLHMCSKDLSKQSRRQKK